MTKRQKAKVVKLIIWLMLFMVVGFLQQHGYLKDLNQPTQSIKEKVEQTTPGLYQVAKFDDGDTIQVVMNNRNETIRFIGVDTPETHDPRKPVQCYGKAAAAFTEKTIGQNRVRLEADPKSNNRDRYNRLLRYVYLPDGTLINKKLVAEGYGFTITAFPFTKMTEFQNAETEARKNKLGLWASCQLDPSVPRNQTLPEVI